MTNFIVGFISGMIIASIGFGGVAQYLDQGVDAIKNTSISVESKK